MEKEKETSESIINEIQTVSLRILLPVIIISGSIGYLGGSGFGLSPRKAEVVPNREVTEKEIVLPVRWGDLGVKMTEAGVINKEKFEALYSNRGGLDEETKKLLNGADNGNLKITQKNSGVLLNLLWALGLGNKNDVLDKGPMMTYGVAGSPAEALAKASGFASTGGWTLAKGGSMDHYSRHSFIVLTPAQQKLVEKVSKNIFRPCCDNPVYFPDCNHGMAMLGLLELMASQGVGEKEMYKTALQVNAYWFPNEYAVAAKHLESRGIKWEDADPKEILGAKYSSGSGYRKILQEAGPQQPQGGGGGCGVDAGVAPAEPVEQNSGGGGCGVEEG